MKDVLVQSTIESLLRDAAVEEKKVAAVAHALIGTGISGHTAIWRAYELGVMKGRASGYRIAASVLKTLLKDG